MHIIYWRFCGPETGFRLRSKSTNAFELAGSRLPARLGTIGVLSESPRRRAAVFGCIQGAPQWGRSRFPGYEFQRPQMRCDPPLRPYEYKLAFFSLSDSVSGVLARECVWRQRSKHYDRGQSESSPFPESKFVDHCHLASPV